MRVIRACSQVSKLARAHFSCHWRLGGGILALEHSHADTAGPTASGWLGLGGGLGLLLSSRRLGYRRPCRERGAGAGKAPCGRDGQPRRGFGLGGPGRAGGAPSRGPCGSHAPAGTGSAQRPGPEPNLNAACRVLRIRVCLGGRGAAARARGSFQAPFKCGGQWKASASTLY